MLVSDPAGAEGDDLSWLRQFGTSGQDEAEAVAADRSGASWVVGMTSGALDGQGSAGTVDAFNRHYGPDGTERWTRQFGSWDNDVAKGVSVDHAGNAYVVGQTFGALPGQASAGGWDAYVRKFDPSGGEVWTRQ
ncbi:MAG: SBBP repeat-containing protein, partial [Acidimicrobiia bacterium]